MLSICSWSTNSKWTTGIGIVQYMLLRSVKDLDCSARKRLSTVAYFARIYIPPLFKIAVFGSLAYAYMTLVSFHVPFYFSSRSFQGYAMEYYIIFQHMQHEKWKQGNGNSFTSTVVVYETGKGWSQNLALSHTAKQLPRAFPEHQQQCSHHRLIW